jgi:ABC-type transport system involved in cytochrome c biogenesis permease subunit
VVVSVIFWLGWGLRVPHDRGSFDSIGFGRIPVIAGGRVKPMDTVARTSLVILSGKQSLRLSRSQELPAIAWLADVMMKPETADEYPSFRIDHPEVRSLLSLSDRDGKQVSYNRLKDQLDEIDHQAKLAQPIENAHRSLFQRSMLKLYQQIDLYQRLSNTLRLGDMADGLKEFELLERAISDGEWSEPHQKSEILGLLENRYQLFSERSFFLLVPPEGDASHFNESKSVGQSLLDGIKAKRIPPSLRILFAMIDAYRASNVEAFDGALGEWRGMLEGRKAGEALKKTDFELRFNFFEPFYRCMVLYLCIFLGIFSGWLLRSESLRKTTGAILLIAFMAHSMGLLARMWIQGRPPVTNLYSSAIFVGWGSVLLGMILERIYRDGMGAMVSSVLGFLTLLVAHQLSADGDTMEMLRAVLDTNYWLATHVVVITLGYASTFLAGFLGLVYVLRGIFSTSLTSRTAKSLERMVYGIICFSTLFSFVGTVLGGIWADQSWGRFWGWDPKENGALMLVLWNVMILHCRLGGMVRQKGTMVMVVLGNIVVSFSWFGVNMLGVGLHSYGWIDQAFLWLAIFMASQLGAAMIGCLPLRYWKSFKSGIEHGKG